MRKYNLAVKNSDLDNINRKRTNDTDENQDAVKVVQALLLKFYGRGPHIPYGVKSAGLAFGKNAKPTGRKYGARGKRVYSLNKEGKMRKFCLIQGVFTSATHAFFCHGDCHV